MNSASTAKKLCILQLAGVLFYSEKPLFVYCVLFVIIGWGKLCSFRFHVLIFYDSKLKMPIMVLNMVTEKILLYWRVGEIRNLT